MGTATIDYLESISYSKAVLRRKEIQVDASDNQRAAARPGGTEGENERASKRAHVRRSGSCISDLGIAMGRAAGGRTDDGVSECVGK